jgi:hypothetical protein
MSWPPRSGATRVLIENPDRADLAAHAFVLEEAGYEVATCRGPGTDDAREPGCPLIAGASCPLVDGADVVVTSSDLGACRAVLAAHRAQGSPPVVFEAPEPARARWHDIAEGTLLLPLPVTATSLREAVASASA